MRGGGEEQWEGGGHASRGRSGWWKRRLCLVLKCCSACACDMGRADMWWLQSVSVGRGKGNPAFHPFPPYPNIIYSLLPFSFLCFLPKAITLRWVGGSADLGDV